MPLFVPDVPPPPLHCTAAIHRDGARPQLARSIVSDHLPIRVHYAPADTTEGRARAVVAAVEQAWEVQVDQLGWRAPVLPDGIDGEELDVYLVRTGDWGAYAAADSFSDDDPDDAYLGTTSYIVVDADLPGAWVDSYLAHEFNHVLQWATDFSEPSTNVWEATATAAQHWTLGAPGAWDADIADFQATPWMPVLYGDGDWLYAHDGTWSLYEYGAAVWPMVLEAGGAGDGTVAVDLWRGLAGRDRDVADGVMAVTGGPLVDFLVEVAAHRLPTPRPDGPPRTLDWPAPDHETLRGEGEITVAARVTGHAFVHLTDLQVPVHVAAVPHGDVEIGLVVVTDDAVMRAVDGVVAVDAPEAWVAVANAGGDTARPYRSTDITVSVVAAPRGCGGSRAGFGLLGLLALGTRRRRQGTAPTSR